MALKPVANPNKSTIRQPEPAVVQSEPAPESETEPKKKAKVKTMKEAPAPHRNAARIEEPAAPEPDAEASEEEDTARKLESDLEIKRATELAVEQHAARQKARTDEVFKQQTSGAGFIDYKKVGEVEDRAGEKLVRQRLAHRGRGVYVISPLTTSNEHGDRIQCPVGMKLPDLIVQRLAAMKFKGKSELDRLISAEVLQDLR
jgi:hypothetical protein